MPPKKKRGHKRNGKRRNRRNKGTYTNKENAGFTFLDPHKYITFKYVEAFSNSIASSSGAQQTMNLNSLFDPNRTGSGHQPYGYDQLAALYNRYRVLKVRWKIVFGSVSGTYMLTVVPVNSLLQSAISDQATFQNASELPHAVIRTQSSGGSTVTVQGSMKLHVLNGVTRTEYIADDRFEAAVGASPTEVMTLVIGFFNPTGSSIVPTYTVEMWFEADLHDPITLSASFDNHQAALRLKGMLKELSVSNNKM